MRGNAERVKERIDIAEVIGGYIEVKKAGANYRARCPFHNEKTPSFFISPARQTYYCFGCGEKGDVFSFVEKMDGVDFKTALKTLADKAGVELSYEKGETIDEKEKLFQVLEEATAFFQKNLEKNKEALEYIKSRGLKNEDLKDWRIGFAQDDWRSLREYMKSKGFADEMLLKAGLIKRSEDHKEKEPYDIFRGRIIFPLSDPRGRVIAFSGRALAKDTELKYLNSPDTPLFTKNEVLYGLDKARDEIRRKNFTVLVEGQMDLVLSHQAGVRNTVASSGTAFTSAHLEKLKRISERIILAFDGDAAGMKAAERSTALALALGLEVKVAKLPEGKDPADLARESGEAWKNALRGAKPAIEIFLDEILSSESDQRKVGKLIEKKLLPYLLLVKSAMERSFYISLIAKRTHLKEDVILEDLKKVKAPEISRVESAEEVEIEEENTDKPSLKQKIEERLEEVRGWMKDFPEMSPEVDKLKVEEHELSERLKRLALEAERGELRDRLRREDADDGTLKEFEALSRKLDEEKRKIL